MTPRIYCDEVRLTYATLRMKILIAFLMAHGFSMALLRASCLALLMSLPLALQVRRVAASGELMRLSRPERSGFIFSCCWITPWEAYLARYPEVRAKPLSCDAPCSAHPPLGPSPP